MRVPPIICEQEDHYLVLSVLFIVLIVFLVLSRRLRSSENQVYAHFLNQVLNQIHVLIVNGEMKWIPHQSSNRVFTIPCTTFCVLNIVNLQVQTPDSYYFLPIHALQHGYYCLGLPTCNQHKHLMISFEDAWKWDACILYTLAREASA